MITLLLGLALAQPAPPPGGPPPPARADRLEEVLAHRDELMELLADHDPDKHTRMLRLERADPQAFALALVRVARHVERLRSDPAALERFQKLRQEEERVRMLAQGFHELSGADKKRRRQELEAAAARILELKQAERRAAVEELRSKIAELEADIERREKEADELVDAFVDQVLMERVDL